MKLEIFLHVEMGKIIMWSQFFHIILPISTYFHPKIKSTKWLNSITLITNKQTRRRSITYLVINI